MQGFENPHILGLIIQSSGAGLLAVLAALLGRSYPNGSLRYWARAWLALCLALTALLTDLLWPHPILQSAYLFGEYVFLYLLVLGCARHLSGRRAVRGDFRLLLPALVLAVLVPPLARGEFSRLFLVQSFVLGLGFSVALWVIWPGLRAWRHRPGMIVMTVSLALLALTFFHYLPIFGWHIATGAPLPMVWLMMTSVAHLLFEFLLGFGGCMVVLEQLNEELVQRNRDLAMASEQFRELAERDPLTGVLNRRAFDAIHPRLSGNGCVAMIDIDRMKQINDGYGHAEGDHALRMVVQRLRTLVRSQDRVFRWGGDELLLLMPGMPIDLLHERLEQLNRDLSKSPMAEGIRLSISFGIAEYGTCGNDPLAAVRRADQAMYARKKANRGIELGALPT